MTVPCSMPLASPYIYICDQTQLVIKYSFISRVPSAHVSLVTSQKISGEDLEMWDAVHPFLREFLPMAVKKLFYRCLLIKEKQWKPAMLSENTGMLEIH